METKYHNWIFWSFFQFNRLIAIPRGAEGSTVRLILGAGVASSGLANLNTVVESNRQFLNTLAAITDLMCWSNVIDNYRNKLFIHHRIIIGYLFKVWLNKDNCRKDFAIKNKVVFSVHQHLFKDGVLVWEAYWLWYQHWLKPVSSQHFDTGWSIYIYLCYYSYHFLGLWY